VVKAMHGGGMSELAEASPETAGSVTPERLIEAIAAFTRGYSIESMPQDIDSAERYPAFLAAGTRVYVAHPPGVDIEDIVAMAERLAANGLRPVPHLAARRIESRALLETALERLARAGATSALVIAGDAPEPSGPFLAAMDLLRTGLLEQYGLENIGVAGHPTGIEGIPLETTEQALLIKAEFAWNTPLDVYIVTQFAFDPEPLLTWERDTGARGIDLPIHVGIAGPTKVKQLMKMGMRCGVRASLRMLRKHAGILASLLTVAAPDRLMVSLARHRLLHPETRIVGSHYFAFGGVEATAQWLNAVARGDILLNDEATGFEVRT